CLSSCVLLYHHVFVVRAGSWEGTGQPSAGPFSTRGDFGSEGAWRDEDASRQPSWSEAPAEIDPALQKPGPKVMDIAEKTGPRDGVSESATARAAVKLEMSSLANRCLEWGGHERRGEGAWGATSAAGKEGRSEAEEDDAPAMRPRLSNLGYGLLDGGGRR